MFFREYKNKSILNTNYWFKFQLFFKHLIGNTVYKKVFRIYFLTVFIAAIFLFLPFSLSQSFSYSGGLSYKSNGSSGGGGGGGSGGSNGNTTYSFFDAIFIAVSAFTNTGLSTHSTYSTFSFTGQLIILLLIQFGGFGFLTVVIFLWNLLTRDRFNVEQRFLFHFERGSIRRIDSLHVIKLGFIILLISELIGAIFLSFFFYFASPSSNGNGNNIPKLKGNIFQSIWSGIFHSVSATNNAGFDILGDKSIVYYRNDANNILSVILLLQSIVGGLGFPVFYDFYQKFKNRHQKWKRKLTLFTKISLLTYCFAGFCSVFLILLFETIPSNGSTLLSSSQVSLSSGSSGSSSSNWGTNATANKLWNAVYLTFSARSAGFSGIEDISVLSQQSQWLLIVLMFIGTSPSSTGGGVRTITIFLILSRMFYTALGYKNLSIFRRTIDKNTVFESCAVFVITCVLIVISTWIISFYTNLSIVNSLFEAASAFGTVGLTSSATKNTTFVGRIFLIILMFIGQLGVTNALLSIKKFKNYEKRTQYCTENIRII